MFCWPPVGYVYMNGDVGKLPAGAVYTAAAAAVTDTAAAAAPPQQHQMVGTALPPEYCMVNGGVAEGGAEGLLSPLSPSAQQQDPAAYSLPQLKQMLSQQLEYYFSR